MTSSSQPSLLSETLEKYKKTIERRHKYVKNEFQAYGLQLAEELEDWKNKSLYIRLAKNTDHTLLEKARYFIKDQSPGVIKSKAKLFMWKLGNLKKELVK